MARAYEDDLRRKLFEAHARGHGSFRTLAAVFGVSLGYVEKIFRQRAQTGKMERVRHRPGRKSLVSPAIAAQIVDLAGAESDITIARLEERIALETGVQMSWSTVREHGLSPALRPGDVVVMDHRSAHKATGVRESIERAGAALLYLPSYSSDLHPIEKAWKAWAKLKQLLRSAQPRTRKELDQDLSNCSQPSPVTTLRPGSASRNLLKTNPVLSKAET